MNFEFNAHQIRILDMRPAKNSVQVNVYNPGDSSHCTANSINVSEYETLDDIKSGLIESGQLSTIVTRAAVIFEE